MFIYIYIYIYCICMYNILQRCICNYVYACLYVLEIIHMHEYVLYYTIRYNLIVKCRPT